jgi:hypothetical protein
VQGTLIDLFPVHEDQLLGLYRLPFLELSLGVVRENASAVLAEGRAGDACEHVFDELRMVFRQFWAEILHPPQHISNGRFFRDVFVVGLRDDHDDEVGVLEEVQLIERRLGDIDLR